MKKYTGWTTRGRPFSPKEFASSHLKKNAKVSYAKYLQEVSKRYKK